MSGLPIVNIGRLMTVPSAWRKDTGPRERSAFGSRLYDSRTRLGLSQGAVAEALGIAQSTIAGLEKTGTGSGHTPSFAKLYGCNVHWLATGDGDPEYENELVRDEPPKPDFKARKPTESEWAVLTDIQVLPHDEREALKKDLHERAEKYRAYTQEVIERMKGSEE